MANGEGGIIVGGNAGASDIKIIDNIVYQADCNLMPRVNAFRPAYLIAPSYYEIRNNYFKGCKAVDYTLSLPSLTHSGNTWVGTLGNDPALVQTQFAGDSFYSYAGDTTNRVVEKWSSYDSSWGYLVFINNTGASTISWVPAGCGSGQSVELRDVMNHSGAPVQTFSCDGTPKTVNTNYSGPVLAPVGSVANQPVHTGNGFRVFTLTKTGSAGNPTPTPTPTPIPGDLNLDRIINSLDFSLLNGRWNQNYSAYDLFIDSIINTFDYAILKNNWGRTW